MAVEAEIALKPVSWQPGSYPRGRAEGRSHGKGAP